MLIANNKLTLKDILQVSWIGHSGDISWLTEVVLEDGSFTAQYFWVIEDFIVGVSVLSFDVEDLPGIGLLDI